MTETLWDIWVTSTDWPEPDMLTTTSTDDTHGVQWLGQALTADYADPDNYDDAEILGTSLTVTPGMVTLEVDWRYCEQYGGGGNVRTATYTAVRVDRPSAQDDGAEYHGVRADADGYKWDLTGTLLTFDECEAFGLAGCGRF